MRDETQPFNSGLHNNGETTNYVCRTDTANGLLLGHGVNSNGDWDCLVTWAGSIFRIEPKNVQVLTVSEKVKFKWVRSDRKSIPEGAIAGGKSANGEVLIIARCMQKAGQHEVPGYVKQTVPTLAFYGESNYESSCSIFDILTCALEPKPGAFAASNHVLKYPGLTTLFLIIGYNHLCLDKNKNCAKLAKAGDCLQNSKFMNDACPSSCGLCGEEFTNFSASYNSSFL